MPRTLMLEDFSHGRATPGRAPAATPDLGEAQRLEAYEQGYSAGWDDAVRAGSDDAGRIAAGLAANLQDLSFTYHEAHAHVLSAIKPILIDALEKLLPSAARAALPALVGERLSELVQRSAGTPMTLMISAADEARIVAVLPPDPGFPLEVKVEDTLAEGQVFLKAGTLEEEIDIDGALTEIAAAITEYFGASAPESTSEERLVANG